MHGSRCYPISELEGVVQREGVTVAIIAVPADSAREIAERLGNAGVRGILNFAPVPLEPSPDLYVENIDMTMSLDKVAFFGRAARQAEL
jgi:redox-sensing transcriptional repressor